ncbi:hypothetical protein C8R43DRAFT_1230881 [Mycena crocata]|nr:hypothetical protein C8R43DRAFT_1230881 [Mycena crocata]
MPRKWAITRTFAVVRWRRRRLLYVSTSREPGKISGHFTDLLLPNTLARNSVNISLDRSTLSCRASRRIPAARWTIISVDVLRCAQAPCLVSLVLLSRRPAGGDIDYCFYRRPASRIDFRKFAAGGQRGAGSSKGRVHLVVFVCRPTASRRAAAAESDYMTYRIPASGFAFRRYADGLFSKKKTFAHLRGGGSDYTMYRNPASGLKFNFLPPEANALLWLQSTVFPQTPVSPTHP